MSNNRNFNILVWNVRGINSKEKWDAIKSKINESSYHILCLQETKGNTLTLFTSRHLNNFAYFPSVGASGGIITIWNGLVYSGEVIQSNAYCVTVKFTSNLDNSCFFLSNVYGPSNAAGKLAFITWFLNLDYSSFDEWIIAGDFNLYRSIEDMNKPGGDPGDMNLFNDFISDMELVDIPFSGRTYTWSNMQIDPLLIKLDWVFCNASWSYHYPSTSVQPLSRPISDHVPIVISFGSSIPKAATFRFENY